MIGAVLAGGDSRRMGQSKAELEWNGEPLWRRQFGLLREAGAKPIALVRRPDQPDLGAPLCWRDTRAGLGPMAGLEAALAEAGRRPAPSPWLAVIAVDMPRLTADWFRTLRAACAPGCGALGRHAEAGEPLAAIYPLEALPEVSRRLDAGLTSLQRLAEALAQLGRMRFLPIADPAPFASVNTPADLA